MSGHWQKVGQLSRRTALAIAAQIAQAAAEAAHAQAGDAAEAAGHAMDRANAVGEASDALPKVLHGTTMPAGTAPDGSIWWQHQGSLSGPVTGQWNRVGGAWVSTPIDSEAIANLDVGKLTSGTAEIAELVSRKIAAATGQFLELDVGQLTVTEQTKLADVVAEQIAADTAQFMELEVGKLVASEGILDEAVIKQLFAEVVVSQMSFAESFIGGNAILEGSITAESGIIGSLDLGVAIVGKLHGQYIEAGSIDTEQLAFGAATGDVLSVDALNFKTAVGLDIRGSSFRAGDAVEVTEDFGIRQFGPDGALNVSLPSDGSPAEFRGDLSARTLTATGRMSIQGPGAIASGGVLELESGVVPPVAGPQITNTWDRTTFPPLTEQEAPAGLAWADGHFWRCVTTSVSLADGGRTRIEKITPDGTLAGGWDTTFRVDVDGITILNGELYVLADGRHLDWTGPGPQPDRMVVVYDLQGVEQRRWDYPAYGTGTWQPGIGHDGLNIMIAQCWASGELSWRYYDPSDGRQIRRVDRDGHVGSDIASIHEGEYDLGASRVVVGASRGTASRVQALVYTNSYTNPEYVSDESWYAADYGAIRGLVWDGSQFHSLQPNGDLAAYQPLEAGKFVGDNDGDWWGAVMWRTGSQETPAGPATNFRYVYRSRLSRQNGDVPQGVEEALFCVSKAPLNDPVSRWDLHVVTVSSTPKEVTYVASLPADWETLRNPPATNTFTTDAPGEIHSAIGNFRVDGSGAGQWGPLKFGADGSMSGPYATGSALIDAVANTPTRVTVTFPVGKFQQPPMVQVTPFSGSPGTVVQGVSVGALSETSVDLVLTRTTSISTTVYWLAVERTE